MSNGNGWFVKSAVGILVCCLSWMGLEIVGLGKDNAVIKTEIKAVKELTKDMSKKVDNLLMNHSGGTCDVDSDLSDNQDTIGVAIRSGTLEAREEGAN